MSWKDAGVKPTGFGNRGLVSSWDVPESHHRPLRGTSQRREASDRRPTQSAVAGLADVRRVMVLACGVARP